MIPKILVYTDTYHFILIETISFNTSKQIIQFYMFLNKISSQLYNGKPEFRLLIFGNAISSQIHIVSFLNKVSTNVNIVDFLGRKANMINKVTLKFIRENLKQQS